MRSHVYQFTPRQLLHYIAPTLCLFLGLAGLLHLTARLDWLPPLPTALHGEETGLRHQAKSSWTQQPAQIVLTGDSTCSVGVDAAALSKALPGQVTALNLALTIGFDLGTYAQLTADFAETNPNQLRWVVLLLSPGKLSSHAQGTEDLWASFREKYRPGRSSRNEPYAQGDYFGIRLLHERLVPYLLPEALRGRGAGFYGFTTGIDQFMSAHNGSALDLGELSLRSADRPDGWSIAPEFEAACRRFREHLPPGVKLAIGLTPSAAILAAPNARLLHRERLNQWNAWIHADLVLTNLPATLPTPCFSPTGHLNLNGQRTFTARLAAELSPVIGPAGGPMPQRFSDGHSESPPKL